MINKYSWKEIDYSSEIDDWKTFEKNNSTIAVNILYIKETKICPAYISKINSNSTNNSVRIPNKDLERWYYLVVKKLSTLLRGITSTITS